MSKIEINFDDLKYNLYEILNTPANSDEPKIKKSFMKIIKTFHPDKSSELEENIYYHIILANQILLNKESRKKYDEYLVSKSENHVELKSSFNKAVKNINETVPNKSESTQLFNNKIDMLNKKHGFNEENLNESVLDRFNKIKNRDIANIIHKHLVDIGNLYDNLEIDFKDVLEYII